MKNRVWIAAGLILVAGVCSLAAIGLSKSSAAPVAQAPTPCSGQPTHVINAAFTPTAVSPSQIVAQRCDELTLTNRTDTEVIVALGPHEHHIQYPGFQESVLDPNQQYSFRLVESGTFPLHDHAHDQLTATIIVH
ncbi:MAG TPA: hypothetical protein VFN56_01530 [Candidatus Saccharimonadales bacterium]|nr:hypothetical protein [Candidatus Saccharimonadales bacterium]